MKKRHKYSLKAQILFVVAFALILGSTMVGFVSYKSASHEVDELFDAQLTQVARLINNLIELHQSLPEDIAPSIIQGWLPDKAFHDGEEADDLGHEYERKFAFQVWDTNQSLVLRSQSAPSNMFTHFEPGYKNVTVVDEGWRVFTLYDDKFGYWLQVAERNDVRDELVESIVFNIIMPFVFGVPLICLLCAFFINKSFFSLTRLKQYLTKTDVGSFTQIQLESKHKEIALVVDALNQLLGSNQEIMEKEKQFIEDAAHELRTPLSVIKIYMQELKASKSKIHSKEIIGKLDKAVERSERMTNQLLTTFRLRMSKDKPVFTNLDLVGVVREAIEEVAPLSLRYNQGINFETIGKPREYKGEGTLLFVMAKNIVDNAITYAGYNKDINVQLVFEEKRIKLIVADNGPGMDDNAKKRAFDRFYRQNTGDTKGAGLGLSIVKEISAIHHAKVQLSNTGKDIGLTVTVIFDDTNIARSVA